MILDCYNVQRKSADPRYMEDLGHVYLSRRETNYGHAGTERMIAKQYGGTKLSLTREPFGEEL